MLGFAVLSQAKIGRSGRCLVWGNTWGPDLGDLGDLRTSGALNCFDGPQLQSTFDAAAACVVL